MSRALLITLLCLPVGCQKESAQNDETNTAEESAAEKPEKTADGQTAGAGRRGHAKSLTKKPPSRPKLDIPAPPDVAQTPADAQKTASGLAYKVLESQYRDQKAPADSKPAATDKVSVHYTGWTTDGSAFDSSRKKGRGKPVTFPLNRVIPGWTEGVQLMSIGDKYRFWIPEELAYKGRAGSPAGILVFDVELVAILRPPPVPKNVAKPPKNAKKTPKGVSYVVLSAGQGGAKPRAQDRVKVHYSGWTTDGKMFDSSITRGKPASFAVEGVIAGWTDALQQMATGDSWRLWIPDELAYKGKPGRPQGMLVFDIELLEVTEMPDPPPVPKDVAGPPQGVSKTAGGVFYKVLQPGKGGAKPTAADKVKIHYTGWTTDGKQFDSSVTRGEPATFPLRGVVPGFREGLTQMSVGEKARLWIPEELAYKGRAGAPQGMLVFDIELIEIL